MKVIKTVMNTLRKAFIGDIELATQSTLWRNYHNNSLGRIQY